MDKVELIKKTEELRISDLSSFPSLNLYMDQVLEILSKNAIFLDKEEKLTSAMVNNYIKEGLLPRAKGKKYSKQHVALLTLISRLKQVLSVKEISSVMDLFGKEDVPQDQYGALYDNIYVEFEKILKKEIESVQKKIEQVNEKDINFLILDLAISSYVQKIVCELVLKNALIEKEEKKKIEAEEKEKEKKEEKAKKKK